MTGPAAPTLTPPSLAGGGVSPWAPLRRPAFRLLWVAALVSNVGTWMHEAAGAWLMTSIAPTPMLVALMQTASSLPFFLLAFPAGALADVVDRRRVLLATQLWMLAAAATLGGFALAGTVTPWVLLGLTFALGLGAAATAPAWQAIVPDLVPRQELPAAVALGGVALNMARAVGPALGGLLVAATAPGVVFLLNAVSFLGVLLALARWRRPAPQTTLPPEALLGAMRVGARYVRHSIPLRTVLARSAGFVVFASAVWALLPLLARSVLGVGAVGYGVLLGCLGLGAITGALLLPWFQRRFSVDVLTALATLVFAAASATLATIHDARLAGPVLIAAGIAWMAVMSTINTAAQTAVSAWVRARALAVSLLVIQGSMALGAVVWGSVAARAGIPMALLGGAGGLGVGLLLVGRFRLEQHAGLDLTPSPSALPPPPKLDADALEDGPVLVTVDYRIDPARADDFLEAMQDLGRVRRRDGAELWEVFRDAADPARFVETFTAESWVEHLRQHARVTVSDRVLRDVARSFHVGAEPPVVTHLIGARARRS